MAIFRFFNMAAAAILDFSNFKLLLVGRLKRAELRRRTKFGRNRSNRGRDMAIFRFFTMAAVRHLGFVMCVFGHPRRAFGGLYHCAKFVVGIDAVVLICMFF